MNESHIEAVNEVRLEAPQAQAQALRWFYTDLAGLEDVTPDDPDPGELCFRSGRIDLTLALTESPTIEDITYRVTIGVPSLESVLALLDEHAMPCETFHGVTWADQRLGVQDPAGNRVWLKQAWPEVPY